MKKMSMACVVLTVGVAMARPASTTWPGTPQNMARREVAVRCPHPGCSHYLPKPLPSASLTAKEKRELYRAQKKMMREHYSIVHGRHSTAFKAARDRILAEKARTSLKIH